MIQLFAWVLLWLCSQAWANDCAPPPPGKKVSDLYYKMCPKKTPETEENTSNTPPTEENRQQTLQEMSKRRGQRNPFTQYPRKDNLYVPPVHNKPWWEQDGQFRHPSQEKTS